MKLNPRFEISLIIYSAVCLSSLLCITSIIYNNTYAFSKLSSVVSSDPFPNAFYYNNKLKGSDFVALGNLNSLLYKDISFNASANNISQSNVCNNNTAIAMNKTGQNLNILPPDISLIHGGKKYYVGNLLDYKYREGMSLSLLKLPLKKINASLPSKRIVVLKGDCLGFSIENDPSALPPASISVDAYPYNAQGKSQVLAITQNAKSIFFKTNLSEGQYVILVVATWLPGNENVSGYEEYNFVINVKDGK